MNKCKITIGKCNICGHVRESESDHVCPMEIYDEVDQWKPYYESSLTEKLAIALIAIAGCFGLAKVFGIY